MPTRSKQGQLKRVKRWNRPIIAYFRMPGSTQFGLLLLIFTVIVVAAVVEINVFYRNPQTGDSQLDTLESIYAVFTLLVFETAYPLPRDFWSRLIFFLVPFSGLVVLGQGLVRLSSALLNRETWERAQTQS